MEVEAVFGDANVEETSDELVWPEGCSWKFGGGNGVLAAGSLTMTMYFQNLSNEK